MKFVAFDGQGRHLGVADSDAGGIDGVVEFGMYFQSGARGDGSYEVDDDLMAGQWSATPVHGYVAEESVSLVPLARVPGGR